MNNLKTNNLPGYGKSNLIHKPILWDKLYVNKKIYLRKISNNRYLLSFDNSGKIYQNKYRYLKIRDKNNVEIPFIIDNLRYNKQVIIPVGIPFSVNTSVSTAVTSNSSSQTQSTVDSNLLEIVGGGGGGGGVENNTLINSESIGAATSSASSTATASASVNGILPVTIPSLVSYNNGSICIGCNTNGLVEYIVIFPGSGPLYTNDDLFIVDGAELFFRL